MLTEFRGPILVVAGCIVIDDSILLSLREDRELVGESPKWELPGGKVEFGEMPEEALKREILEELNLGIRPLSLIPYIQTNLWEKGGIKKHYAIVCYDCTPIESDIPSLLTQLPSKAALFRKDEIDFSKTLPGTREFVYRSTLLGKRIEEEMSCAIRLEPAESAKYSRLLASIEIRVVPSNIPNCLGIHIAVVMKSPAARLQVPSPLHSYVYSERHIKRPRVIVRLFEEEVAVQEFGQIINGLRSEGFLPTQAYGHSRFLDEIPALT